MMCAAVVECCTQSVMCMLSSQELWQFFVIFTSATPAHWNQRMFLDSWKLRLRLVSALTALKLKFVYMSNWSMVKVVRHILIYYSWWLLVVIYQVCICMMWQTSLVIKLPKTTIVFIYWHVGDITLPQIPYWAVQNDRPEGLMSYNVQFLFFFPTRDLWGSWADCSEILPHAQKHVQFCNPSLKICGPASLPPQKNNWGAKNMLNLAWFWTALEWIYTMFHKKALFFFLS